MRNLTRTLLVGSLATALSLCGVKLMADEIRVRAPAAPGAKFDLKIVPGLVLKGSGNPSKGSGGPQGGFGQGKGPGQGQGNFGQGGKGPGKGPGPGFGKGPGNHPKHPHHWPPHHPHHPRPIITYRPIIVESAPQYYEDAANPVPAADIQLVNPAENRWPLNYRLDDGEVQSLSAGYSVNITRVTVITFDRGGGAGWARYQLTDGIYKFVASGGAWDLVHQPFPDQ